MNRSPNMADFSTEKGMNASVRLQYAEKALRIALRQNHEAQEAIREANGYFDMASKQMDAIIHEKVSA